MDMTLEGDGFEVVGWIALESPSTFVVHFDRIEAKTWAPALYAFRIGGEVVRIGKTESPLRGRIRDWERDVSRALAGKEHKGGTSLFEASEWRKRLIEHGRGEILAQIGPADLLQLRKRERKLIRDYKPPLCGDAPGCPCAHPEFLA